MALRHYDQSCHLLVTLDSMQMRSSGQPRDLRYLIIQSKPLDGGASGLMSTLLWLPSDISLTNVKPLSLLYTKPDRAKLIYYLFTLTFLFNAFSILVSYRSSRFNREEAWSFSHSVSLNMFHKYCPSGFLGRNLVFTITSFTLLYCYEEHEVDL